MADNKIFFSYSRDNSEFVIELAKELREAGATIWLDQLDIKPGTRWDRSIEQALKSSNTLLIILSKSSVESHNVMDEVSYALEENRIVVPVLLEECDIPFRLRRLQYADFTGDHDTGIKTLIKALNLEKDVASKLVDIAAEVESTKKQTQPAPVKAKEEKKPQPSADPISAPLEVPKPTTPEPKKPKVTQSSAASEPKSKSKAAVLIGLGLVVAVLIGVFAMGGFGGDNSTQNDNQPNDNGITTVKSQLEDGTIIIDSVLTETPVVSEVSEEDKAWETAQIKDDVDGYIKFMTDFPEGADEKFETIEERFGEFFPQEGYIQYSTSGGMSYFRQLYFEEKGVPVVGDILEALYDRNIKAGSFGNPGFNRTLKVMKAGEQCFVIDVIPSGSAYWVKIMY